MTQTSDQTPLAQLRSIMERLRDPQTGCPWDVEQTFATIAPYTIEEAYEVDDAIRRGDMEELRSELGDLLLQVVFHARMAEEAGLFNLDDVANSINDKMIRRHPHVFGNKAYSNADEQTADWEAIKRSERESKKSDAGLLDDIPAHLPALKRAQKLQKRAGTVGFDWPEAGRVLDKVEEEIGEIKEAMASGNAAEIQEEIGDLLFVCVNLARKLKVDAETATRDANAKFERRFRSIEQALKADNRTTQDASLEEMEELWTAAKNAEKAHK